MLNLLIIIAAVILSTIAELPSGFVIIFYKIYYPVIQYIRFKLGATSLQRYSQNALTCVQFFYDTPGSTFLCSILL